MLMKFWMLNVVAATVGVVGLAGITGEAISKQVWNGLRQDAVSTGMSAERPATLPVGMKFMKLADMLFGA